MPPLIQLRDFQQETALLLDSARGHRLCHNHAALLAKICVCGVVNLHSIMNKWTRDPMTCIVPAKLVCLTLYGCILTRSGVQVAEDHSNKQSMS